MSLTIKMPYLDIQSVSDDFGDWLTLRGVKFKVGHMRDGGSVEFSFEDGTVMFGTNIGHKEDNYIEVTMKSGDEVKVGHELRDRYKDWTKQPPAPNTPTGLKDLFR
jgi:hypothetical protein